LNVGFVAHNGGNGVVDDRLTDGIDSERRIHGDDADALREASNRGNRPFHARVFKDGHAAGRGDLVEGRHWSRWDRSGSSQRGTKLEGFFSDFRIRQFGNLGTEFFDFLRFPSNEPSLSHAKGRTISIQGLAKDLKEGCCAIRGEFQEISFGYWQDTMGELVGNGNRSEGVGLGQCLKDIDPAKGQERDLW
jgi:hypothetical protein